VHWPTLATALNCPELRETGLQAPATSERRLNAAELELRLVARMTVSKT